MSGEIYSLKDVIRTLTKNVSKNNNRLNTTNKIINELIERSKGSEEKQKELNDYGEKWKKGIEMKINMTGLKIQ